MEKILKGKIAFITGASSGIGKALAVGFAKLGADIVNADLNPAGGGETKKEVEDQGQKALTVECNVQDYESVKSAVDKAISEFGKIDVLINNAGYSKLKAIMRLKVGEFQDILNTNVLGVYNVTHAVVPHMAETKGGSIISTGSLAAKMSVAKWSAYGMSKAAILGFTANLGAELKRNKINVNSIMPNMVDTPLLRQGLSDEDIERLKPMQAEELVPYYAFFATKKGSRTTGINVDVEIIQNVLSMKEELPEEEKDNPSWKALKDIAKEKMKDSDYREASQARALIDFLFKWE